MKNIFVLLLLVHCTTICAFGQNTKQHKIVFEITSADTADQVTVLRQINNVMKDVPGTKVEVVCHGPAIFMLVKEKTVTEKPMLQLKEQFGVQFAACANSMKKNNIDKTQLVSVATVVPNGVMEVVDLEEKGWSYIKAGH